LLSRWDIDLDESASLGIALLQSPNPLKDLVPFLELSRINQAAELLKIAR
jgi:hypothetical protein